MSAFSLALPSTAAFFEDKLPSAVRSILCDGGPYLNQMSLSSFKTLPRAHLLYDSSTFLKHYLVTNSFSFMIGKYKLIVRERG